MNLHSFPAFAPGMSPALARACNVCGCRPRNSAACWRLRDCIYRLARLDSIRPNRRFVEQFHRQPGYAVALDAQGDKFV